MAKKFLISLVALSALTMGVWAQIPTLPTVPSFQADPKSPVKAVSGRFSLDEDKFLDVLDYKTVEFETSYFFLGGAANAAANGGVQGGYATKLGGGQIGVYFNGNLFSGDGENWGKKDSADNEIHGETRWNTQLGILYGSEAIGGIRLDILFNNTQFKNDEYGKDQSGSGAVKKEVYNSPFITTLNYGRSLTEDIPLLLTLGFQWPESQKQESSDGASYKQESWQNAILLLEAGSGYKDFSADYALTINMGTTAKVDTPESTMTQTGWVDNTVNVAYAIKAPITEKLTLKLKPKAEVRLAWVDNKTKTTISGSDVETATAPQTWFQISPKVDIGACYDVNEKLSLYTGIKVAVLTITSYSEGKYTPGPGQSEVEDTPSWWDVQGISFPNGLLSFAGNFKFSDNFSLNASISSDLLQVRAPGSSGGGYIGIANPFNGSVANLINAGSVTLNFKPAAK